MRPRFTAAKNVLTAAKIVVTSVVTTRARLKRIGLRDTRHIPRTDFARLSIARPLGGDKRRGAIVSHALVPYRSQLCRHIIHLAPRYAARKPVVDFARPLSNRAELVLRTPQSVYLSLTGPECVDLSRPRRILPDPLAEMIHPLLCQKAFNLPPVAPPSPSSYVRLMQDTRCSGTRARKDGECFLRWNHKI